MNKKLIFFDIDNTLVYHEEHKSNVPEATKRAVKLLKDNGHKVVFSSGRSRINTVRCAKEVDMNCDGLFNNGSHVVYSGNAIYENRIESELVNSIYDDIKSDNVSIFGAEGDVLYEYNASAFTYSFIKKESGGKDVLRPFPFYIPPLLALTVYGLKEAWSGQDVICSKYKDVYFCDDRSEIVKKGTSKGSGLIMMANYLGFPISDVIAVGDGINDIDIIKAAGCGIAVGNACSELKEVADLITDNINDYGIFNVFKKIGLI